MVSVSELKANLSRCLREVHRGGEYALVVASSKLRQLHRKLTALGPKRECALRALARDGKDGPREGPVSRNVVGQRCLNRPAARLQSSQRGGQAVVNRRPPLPPNVEHGVSMECTGAQEGRLSTMMPYSRRTSASPAICRSSVSTSRPSRV